MPTSTASLLSPQSHAQSYPSKPLSIVVPFDTGGPGDILARAIGEPMGRELGQPVLIINKPGAAGIIGVDTAVKAAADGYTLLIGGDASVINAASGRKLPYNFLRDLAPISPVYAGAQFLLVKKDSGFNSVQDLVKYAKQHPGQLKFGSGGVGSSIHLSSELFAQAAGISALHVPYKGIAQAMNDVAGGHIDYVITGAPGIPAIRNGSFKGLAILGREKSQLLPELPTAIEQGVAIEVGGWYGLLAPAGTPQDAIRRVHAALVKTLALKEIGERFRSLGGEPKITSPEQFALFLRGEMEKYAVLTRKLDLKLD